jgi:hypothetical protein
MRLLPLFLLAALVSLLSAPVEARPVDVVKNPDGGYIVTDVQSGTSYGTNDLRPLLAYLSHKGKVEGFGGPMTQRQFQTPTVPIYVATDAARSVARTTLRDASRVPVAGIVVRPLQKLLAATTPKRPAQ